MQNHPRPGKRGDIYNTAMEPHPKLWMNPNRDAARGHTGLHPDTKCKNCTTAYHPLREHTWRGAGQVAGTCMMAGCGCQRFAALEEASNGAPEFDE